MSPGEILVLLIALFQRWRKT